MPEGAHADPRGLLLFPDVLETDLIRYDALVNFLEAKGAFWASTEPVAPDVMERWRLQRVSPVRFLLRQLRQALPW